MCQCLWLWGNGKISLIFKKELSDTIQNKDQSLKYLSFTDAVITTCNIPHKGWRSGSAAKSMCSSSRDLFQAHNCLQLPGTEHSLVTYVGAPPPNCIFLQRHTNNCFFFKWAISSGKQKNKFPLKKIKTVDCGGGAQAGRVMACSRKPGSNLQTL